MTDKQCIMCKKKLNEKDGVMRFYNDYWMLLCDNCSILHMRRECSNLNNVGKTHKEEK